MLNKRLSILPLFLLAGLLMPLPCPAADRGAPVSEAVTADITNRVDKLEQLLQNQGLLDMLQQVEGLQAEINRLRGEVELQTHTLEQLKKQQRDVYSDLDRRMQRLETGATTAATQIGNANPPLESLPPSGSDTPSGMPESITEPALAVETIERPVPDRSGDGTEALVPEKISRTETMESPAMAESPLPAAAPVTKETPAPAATTEVAAEPPVTAMAATDPAREKADYDKAFNLLKQTQYAQAIKEFNQFLASYPGSQYADNAQYWMAEANYVTQQYESAMKEYEKLIVQYPDSQKIAHAQLKIGYCYYELGQLDEAQRRLEDLKQRYPDTTAGRLAEEKLKQIRPKAP